MLYLFDGESFSQPQNDLQGVYYYCYTHTHTSQPFLRNCFGKEEGGSKKGITTCEGGTGLYYMWRGGGGAGHYVTRRGNWTTETMVAR